MFDEHLQGLRKFADKPGIFEMTDIGKGFDIHAEQRREGQVHDRLVNPFLDFFRDF
jgi:hypothetical protein